MASNPLLQEETMSAVLLAIFNEYEVAERVRIELVRDGFRTDRVELTANCEPGRAGLEPADSGHGRLVQYFRVLFSFEDEQHYAEQLAECVDNGDAIITVHPRGSMETRRATQILGNAAPMQIMSHDLANQSPWCAVSKRARPWILGALALSLLLAGYRVGVSAKLLTREAQMRTLEYRRADSSLVIVPTTPGDRCEQ